MSNSYTAGEKLLKLMDKYILEKGFSREEIIEILRKQKIIVKGAEEIWP